MDHLACHKLRKEASGHLVLVRVSLSIFYGFIFGFLEAIHIECVN